MSMDENRSPHSIHNRIESAPMRREISRAGRKCVPLRHFTAFHFLEFVWRFCSIEKTPSQLATGCKSSSTRKINVEPKEISERFPAADSGTVFAQAWWPGTVSAALALVSPSSHCRVLSWRSIAFSCCLQPQGLRFSHRRHLAQER
jgi:hypothetical protein